MIYDIYIYIYIHMHTYELYMNMMQGLAVELAWSKVLCRAMCRSRHSRNTMIQGLHEQTLF